MTIWKESKMARLLTIGENIQVLTRAENLNKALCRNRKALCMKNKSAMKAVSALKAESAMNLHNC